MDHGNGWLDATLWVRLRRRAGLVPLALFAARRWSSLCHLAAGIAGHPG
ncbi:MAG: hypothetical protein U1F67_01945 [Rubrivivax sp.]